MINGLVLRPNAAYCGSAFGHGTYFAPSSQKSFDYTSGSNLWRDNSGHTGSIFLGIFDVATGKPYDIYREKKGHRIMRHSFTRSVQIMTVCGLTEESTICGTMKL